MRGLYWYLITFFIIFLLFRFFGFIMLYVFKFWYIVIPAVFIIGYYSRKKREAKKFHNKTGLDPSKEVKLKKDPEINVEDGD